jgi:uncharacterized membrane protein (UPF0127 family)
MPHRTLLAPLLLLLALLTPTAGPAQEEPALDLASFPRTDLTIRNPKSKALHSFRVWIADTPQRAEQGLMFVRDLPESQGMVFPFEPPRVSNMWMKNTYIELDMLFIDAHGRVLKITEHAPPLSLETISSGAPVAATLELKGGAAGRLGLQVGDEVSWTRPAP